MAPENTASKQFGQIESRVGTCGFFVCCLNRSKTNALDKTDIERSIAFTSNNPVKDKADDEETDDLLQENTNILRDSSIISSFLQCIVPSIWCFALFQHNEHIDQGRSKCQPNRWTQDIIHETARQIAKDGGDYDTDTEINDRAALYEPYEIAPERVHSLIRCSDVAAHSPAK